MWRKVFETFFSFCGVHNLNGSRRLTAGLPLRCAYKWLVVNRGKVCDGVSRGGGLPYMQRKQKEQAKLDQIAKIKLVNFVTNLPGRRERG